MFCKHCGDKVPEGAKFCKYCGKSVDPAHPEADAESETVNHVKIAPPVHEEVPAPPMQAPALNCGITPGFTTKTSDPTFIGSIKKTGKGTLIFGIVLILLPLLVTFFLSIKNGDFSYMIYGAVISAAFLIENIIMAAKKKADKQWDGTVTDKHTQQGRKRGSEKGEYETYTEYVTVFCDSNGKTRKCVEGTNSNDAHPTFDYLNVGDIVRYHPEFDGFYEKYNKVVETHIFCPSCKTWNEVKYDYCQKCGMVVLK